jgi:hypothetical protein
MHLRLSLDIVSSPDTIMPFYSEDVAVDLGTRRLFDTAVTLKMDFSLRPGGSLPGIYFSARFRSKISNKYCVRHYYILSVFSVAVLA